MPPGQVAAADAANLEAILDELCQYGEPRLSKHNTGWYAIIELFVSGTGVKFEVKTDFKHPTARDAAATCLDRLHDALRSIGK